MYKKTIQLTLVSMLMLFLMACEVEAPVETTYRAHTCRSSGDAKLCDSDDEDPYCECTNSPTCEAYCQYDIMKVYFSLGRGGRICGTVNGCIPPVDLRALRIIFFTTNPAESVSAIRSLQSVQSSNGDIVFAKGELESYDEKTQEATFKYIVINEKLTHEELTVDITAFTSNKNNEVKMLSMQSDPFPKGHFMIK